MEEGWGRAGLEERVEVLKYSTELKRKAFHLVSVDGGRGGEVSGGLGMFIALPFYKPVLSFFELLRNKDRE